MFSTSQPIATNVFEDTNETISATQGNTCCNDCKRIFKNERGLKQHSRTCKMTAVPSTLLHAAISSGSVIINNIDTLTNDDTKDSFMTEINDAYEKMTVWRKNLFQLPKGRHGKEFINEMTKQIDIIISLFEFGKNIKYRSKKKNKKKKKAKQSKPWQLTKLFTPNIYIS